MAMSATERLKFVLTADASGAISAFEKVGGTAEKELKKADSGIAKASAQLTKFGTGAIVAASVTGTALVGLAGKFSELGVSVGKFSTATGLSAEKSSRFIEVAGDMGIEADAVESAINKMNRTVGTSPDKFADLGVEISRTSDGAVDAQQTFLNVIDRLKGITDPAERASVGTQLLGKSWTGMSELIAAGSSDLTASLAAVNGAKVLNDEEVQKAKDYRAAMDTLKDSLEELGLSIGAGAAPVIGTLATLIGNAVSAFGSLDSITGGAAGNFLAIATAGIGAAGAISAVAGSTLKMSERFHDADGQLNNFGKSAQFAGIATAAFAVAVIAGSVLNKFTTDTTGATDALNTFIIAANKNVKEDSPAKQILDDFRTLSEDAYHARGVVDQILPDIGQMFDKSGQRLNHLTASFDDLIEKSPQSALAIVKAMKEAQIAAAGGDEAMKDYLASMSLSPAKMQGFADKVAALGLEQVNFSGNAQKANDIVAAQTSGQKDAADAIQATTDALKAQEAAQQAARLEALRSIDADFDYRASVQDTKDALEDYTKKMGDHKLSAEEQQIATDEMVTTMALQASAYAESKGFAEGSKGAIDAMITSLYLQAAAAAPGSALQTGLNEYIVKLQAINAGLTPDALRLFNLNNFNGKAVNMHMGEKASGGIAKPGLTLVGEQGPELVIMNGGENVLTASQTASAMAGGGSPSGIGGASINLTVNAGLGTDGNVVGQQIVNMLKQYQRTNGPFDFTSR